MDRDLALTHDEGAWPVQPYDPAAALAQRQDQASMLDLPTLLRITRDWRWRILGNGGWRGAGEQF